MFPLLLVSLSRGLNSSGSVKLLNNRSSEAVGRLWHLSPITVEPPFSCHRPDQPDSHIYDPLSAVTSVEHLSPATWPSHKYWGYTTSAGPLVSPSRILHFFFYCYFYKKILSGCLLYVFFNFFFYCCSMIKWIEEIWMPRIQYSPRTMFYYSHFHWEIVSPQSKEALKVKHFQ